MTPGGQGPEKKTSLLEGKKRAEVSEKESDFFKRELA